MHARVLDERGADVALARQQRSASGGTPASRSASTTSSARSPGVCSAGLSSTALPVARPAATMPSGIATGKFQGEITATTPRGA